MILIEIPILQGDKYEIVLIHKKHIQFIKSIGDKTIIHTSNGSIYESKLNLEELKVIIANVKQREEPSQVKINFFFVYNILIIVLLIILIIQNNVKTS